MKYEVTKEVKMALDIKAGDVYEYQDHRDIAHFVVTSADKYKIKGVCIKDNRTDLAPFNKVPHYIEFPTTNSVLKKFRKLLEREWERKV